MTRPERHCVGLLLGALVLGAASSATAQQAPIVRSQLANGLQVLIQEDHHLPRVGVTVAYSVGERDDPPGYAGLAHVVEHLTCGPTPHVPEGTSERLENAGAIANAMTGPDATIFIAELPSSAWETALWVVSERMAYALAAIDSARVDHEREILRRELKERSGVWDPMPDAVARAMYPVGHPYRLAHSDPEDYNALDLQAVRWFSQHWYGPKRAVLAIVGDVRASDVSTAVSKYFATIRNSAALAPTWAIIAGHSFRRPQRIAVPAPDWYAWRNDRLRVVWPTPASFSADDTALDVAAVMLERRLRDHFVKYGDAYAVDVSQQSAALGSEFIVSLDLVPGCTLDSALGTVEQEIAGLQQPDTLFAVARARLVAESVRGADDLVSRARLLAESTSAGAATSLEDRLAAYRALTADDVARVVRNHLSKRTRVIATATPGE